MLLERNEHIENDEIGYIESVFNSGNVMKTTYFPKSNRLYIAFKRGDTYSYANISPEFYDEFENAESQGKFFYKNINNNGSYPYRREFTLYPSEIDVINETIQNKLNDLNDE